MRPNQRIEIQTEFAYQDIVMNLYPKKIPDASEKTGNLKC